MRQKLFHFPAKDPSPGGHVPALKTPINVGMSQSSNGQCTMFKGIYKLSNIKNKSNAERNSLKVKKCEH